MCGCCLYRAPGRGCYQFTWERLLSVYLGEVVISLPGRGCYQFTWERLLSVYLGEVVISLPGRGCYQFTGVSSNSTAVVRSGVSPLCGVPASLDTDSESNQRRQQH